MLVVASMPPSRAQTGASANRPAADMGEQLVVQVQQWFATFARQGRLPRVFTGITRDARQMIIELDGLPFDDAKRRDFLVWLCWKRSILAYAYATRDTASPAAGQGDPVAQLHIYASSFEKDVMASFSISTKPDGSIDLHRERHTVDAAVADAKSPFLGLHRGLKPETLTNNEEFEKALVALSEKIYWRQVAQAPAQPDDSSPTGLVATAMRHYGRGGYDAALGLSTRAAEMLRQQGRSLSKEYASALVVQALSQKRLQRLKEAEGLYREAIDVLERAAGTIDSDLAVALDNLASLYADSGRYGDAEPLRLRALAIFKSTLPPNSPSIGTVLQNIAVLYNLQGRHAEAKERFLEALPIVERAHGPDSHAVGVVCDNLAGVYRRLQELDKAETNYLRAIRIFRRVHGRAHSDTATALQNYAILLGQINRLGEAEANLKEAIAIHEELFGPVHPGIAIALDTLALDYIEKSRWQDALEAARRSAAITLSRAEIDDEQPRSARDRQGLGYQHLVHAAFGFDASEPQLMSEAFVAAQRALTTDAARAVSQVAVRLAAGTDDLAAVVRERQDLVARAKELDKSLIQAVAAAPDKRNRDVEARIKEQAGEASRRLVDIDRRLETHFPQFAALSKPSPLSIAETQALLNADEVLVQFIDLPNYDRIAETGFAWLITKETAEWVRLPIGAPGLWRAVTNLRCGLDAKAWSDKTAETCRQLLKVEAPGPNGMLPFDLEIAHQLYRSLLGPFDQKIRGRHLLVVPSGALTGLPLSVLVTEKPAEGRPQTSAGYRNVAWLGVRQPITILPSVAALKSLRQFPRRVAPARPYLGIGNPLLAGPQDDPQWGAYYRQQAALAQAAQDCRAQSSRKVTPPVLVAQKTMEHSRLVRSAHADIELIRQAAPLPETTEEICTVGARLGAVDGDILLGARATEDALKSLSERGQLAEYAVLHFATHGTLAGELGKSSEPGLILTPPTSGTTDATLLSRDDGFLTISEIASLKLNSDWVVLSACNTAGGSNDQGDALSGMARAFFYAGSKALLVSHWEVASEAAVKLVTRSFEIAKATPGAGRAEAFRLSMREMIANGLPTEAHPAQWAPFIVVGEGNGRLPVVTAQSPRTPPSAKQKRVPRSNLRSAAPQEPAPDWRADFWAR